MPSKGKSRKKSKGNSSTPQLLSQRNDKDKEDFRPTFIKLTNSPGDWVKINFKLLHWNFMDFTSSPICVRTTTIKWIREELERRHNTQICSLKLYNEKYDVDKELPSNDFITLETCGISGGPNEETARQITIYYDFDLPKSQNAVLLAF